MMAVMCVHLYCIRVHVCMYGTRQKECNKRGVAELENMA